MRLRGAAVPTTVLFDLVRAFWVELTRDTLTGGRTLGCFCLVVHSLQTHDQVVALVLFIIQEAPSDLREPVDALTRGFGEEVQLALGRGQGWGRGLPYIQILRQNCRGTLVFVGRRRIIVFLLRSDLCCLFRSFCRVGFYSDGRVSQSLRKEHVKLGF
jgi:hypothetical protein